MTIDTDTQYDQLVREGREAREHTDNMQWIEGDLALRVEVLPSDERPRDPETGGFIEDPDKALKRYAEDIEVNYATLKNYRRTAEAWPPTTRARASWRTHHTLAALDDRFGLIQPGMAYREARAIVQQRSERANYTEPGWHELLGHVGEALKHAEKDLTRFEDVLGDRDPKSTREKAGAYAEWAEGIATRLRAIESA